jgi:S-adenosylmethionine decarboxylase
MSAFNEIMYDFKGSHYIASFKNCVSINNRSLVKLFETAILKSGATILDYKEHVFGSPDEESSGITFVFLLSESHCSVHTYPEHNSMFIDLFTCGDKIDNTVFHETIVEGLKPGDVSKQILIRN